MLKIFFDNFTAFLQHFERRQFFDQCTYWIMDNSAYFVKSTPRIILILRRYVTDILEMCMKNFHAKSILNLVFFPKKCKPVLAYINE